MRKLILAVAFLFLVVPVRAKDLYVAQSSSQTSGGGSCGSPLSIGWFNNPASWGSGSNQIGPGTTVHLCGTFRGAAGEQLLKVRSSGSSGNPITLKFESGAIFTAPYWSPLGAIYANGVSYITIDGGTNGVIQNTANGTGMAFHSDSRAVYAVRCTGCTVQNLNVSNLYVRTSSSDLTVNQTAVNCVYFNNSNNFTVKNISCNHAGWAIAGFGNNFTLEHSNISNIDHGLAFGPPSGISGLSIHDNHIHDFANWDSATNRYHHDGLHIWGQRGGSIANGSIYNNLFDGDSGVNITADIYLQDSVRSVSVYNNVFTAPKNRVLNVLWFAAGSTGMNASQNSAYNNTIAAGGQKAGSAMFVQSQMDFTAQNNILQGGSSDISIQGGGTLSSKGIDHNTYQDLFADYRDTNTFGIQGAVYHDLPGWQRACHCDANSRLVPGVHILKGAVGQLLPGSVGISAGTNLTTVALGILAPLAADKAGAPRPVSGPWDMGALQSGAAVVRLPAPSGVTATIK
jgi:hypothetical protein